MPFKGSMRAGILPGCPSLDRGSREAEVGFEPRTFRSVNSHSNHLVVKAQIYRPEGPWYAPDLCPKTSLPRLGQPGSISAFRLPSGGMAVRHQEAVTASITRKRESVGHTVKPWRRWHIWSYTVHLSVASTEHTAKRKDLCGADGLLARELHVLNSVIYDTPVDGLTAAVLVAVAINRSAVTPFQWIAAMTPEGSKRAELLLGCPGVDRNSRET
ncbi:hypothetical protein CSKR_107169 [Clonorchis sinensis]|uniref:Uncharacterized protein n=1 Tax=Clonorchis sinensis TaxID=79923 RepID=A0A3R7G3Y6_CLOSI|nr:hypothetical protein CSKR_107169 [Clonorchis sinensis]